MMDNNIKKPAYCYGYVERRVSSRDEYALAYPSIMEKLPKIGLRLPEIKIIESSDYAFC